MRLEAVFFWFLVLFLPTQLGRHFWPKFSFVSGVRVDFLSPTIFWTDILTLATLVFFLARKGIRIKWKKYWVVLLAFFYLFLVSCLARLPLLSFLKLFKFLELFCFAVFLMEEKPFARLAKPLSLALLGESLLCLYQFFKGHSLGGIFWWLGERPLSFSSLNISLGSISGRVFLRPYGTFSHPNSLAGFFLVAVLLVLKDRKLPLWWKTLIATFSFSVLLVSFSQVVWLAGIACLFIFFLLRIKKSRRNFLLLPSAFGLIAVLLAVSAFLLKGNPAETHERIRLFRAAWAMIKTSPVFGVGLGGFIPLLPKFWHEGKLLLLQPVHNIFLLVAAEAGLLGFVVFGVFFLKLFKKALKDPFLLLAVFSIFLTGLFDHYWLTLQQNLFLFTVVAAFVWSLP